MLEHFLIAAIRALAASLARRIERSPTKAAAGFAVGASGGLWIAWQYTMDHVGASSVVLLMLLGGFAGAMIGTVLPANKESEAAPPAMQREGFIPLRRPAEGPIRVTNYNAAMAPVVVFAISLVVVSLAVYAWRQPRKEPPDEMRFLLIAAGFIAGVVAIVVGRRLPRQILWIEIDGRVTVGGLLRRRVYELSQIEAWRLSLPEVAVVADTSQKATLLTLLLKDGLWLRTEVSPLLAERISEELGRVAPVAAVTPFCLS